MLSLKSLALATAIAVPLALTPAALASAAPSSPTIVGVPGSVAATAANLSKITTAGTVAVFKPTKVTGKEIAAGSTCSTTNYSVAVANTTTKPQQLTTGGKKLGKPIKPKFELLLCGTTAGTATIDLASNAKTSLKVTITA